jgi:hypothetical protein
MRESGRVDDDEIDVLACRGMHALDQGRLRIALESRQLHAGVGGRCFEPGVDVEQAGVTVVLRLARAQQVQIRPVQDQDVAHPFRDRFHGTKLPGVLSHPASLQQFPLRCPSFAGIC